MNMEWVATMVIVILGLSLFNSGRYADQNNLRLNKLNESLEELRTDMLESLREIREELERLREGREGDDF